MKSFYTVLYVPIRPDVSEMLTVGLFMRSKEEIIFRHSKQKLGVLKNLLPKQAYNLLKLTLHSIERETIKAKEDFDLSLIKLIPDETTQYQYVNEPYIEYLSKYNTNLLAFTSPQYIDFQVNFKNYESLFEKLIAENEFISRVAKEPKDVVKKTKELLKPKIETRVNWDFKVTNKYLKNLIPPSIAVDFIGKNGRYVSGETINFEKDERVLTNEISRFITLIDAMRGENKQSKCFILGKEPFKKDYSLQHQLWKNIKNSERINFIDADEYEEVVQYLESHDVQPLLKI